MDSFSYKNYEKMKTQFYVKRVNMWVYLSKY